MEASADARRLSVTRYVSDRKADWDHLVDRGKNATFLFRRDYMGYHADRFEDHSLVIWKDSQVVALLPANQRDDSTICSHEGLTYGGFVMRRDATLTAALEIVHASLAYLAERGVETLLYKRLPRFYNTLPDDEIDYALWLLGATLIRRDCALVVSLADRLPVRKGKKSEIKRGGRAGLAIVEETMFDTFWRDALEPRLWERYGVKPVHTVEEITLLAMRFPQHIKQYSAYAGKAIVAGVTIYETPTVAHAQYSSVTADGETLGALDYLNNWLIAERYKDKLFFDFGICNEQDGRALNHGLLQSKESLGARSFAHDLYEIRTGKCANLHSFLPAPAEASAGDART